MEHDADSVKADSAVKAVGTAKADTAVRTAQAPPAPLVTTAPATANAATMLDWIKVVGPLVLSWPLVVLTIVLVFQAQLGKVFDRFAETDGSTAEFGPIKIALGKLAAVPPQYRDVATPAATERVDLADSIGEIRDTGPESSTVGFALAYAVQSEIKLSKGQRITVSPRGIYNLARRFDEWPGEADEGTSVDGGLKALMKGGAYLESDWPYAEKKGPPAQAKPVFRIRGYSPVGSVDEIRKVLLDNHVVVAEVMVTRDFDDPGPDGTVTVKLASLSKSNPLKAITIVGYESANATFTFANDWGKNWGRGGFGVIKDTDLAQILAKAYRIEL